MEELQDTFDGAKLLSEYKTMTVAEVVSFLGKEHADILMQRLEQGDVTRDKIYEICNSAYPKYKLRADLMGTIIESKLPAKGKYYYLREQGVSEEQISMVQKMDDYKDKVQDGTLKESELQEICNMVFGENTDIGKQVYEALKIKVLPDKIDEYIEYREQLNKLYLENQNSTQTLISSFEMIDGDIKLCKHTLEQINGNNKVLLMKKTFEFDTGFQLHFLEPALIDFAQHNRVASFDIVHNQSNPSSSNYQALAESNNTLNVININPAYATSVANVVSRIEPIDLEKHESKSETLEQSYQKTLSKSGFTNTFGIIEMIVFTISIIVFLFFIFKLMFAI